MVTKTSLTFFNDCLICRAASRPFQERHHDVEHDDVGLEPHRFGDELASVGGLADDVALMRQQRFERAEQERVIVGQQHPWLGHTSTRELDRHGFGWRLDLQPRPFTGCR